MRRQGGEEQDDPEHLERFLNRIEQRVADRVRMQLKAEIAIVFSQLGSIFKAESRTSPTRSLPAVSRMSAAA
jgi:uncharacterized protein (DUF849 family)